MVTAIAKNVELVRERLSVVTGKPKGAAWWRVTLAPDGPLPPSRLDYVLATILGLIAAIAASILQTRIPVSLYSPNNYDVWFDADMPRILGALNDRTTELHYRTNVHPLFSLASYPFVALFRMLGLPTIQGALLLVSLCAMATASLLYLSLRRLGRHWWEAALACSVFVTSATFCHWFTVAETYAFTSVSAIVTLFLFLGMSNRANAGLALASAASLALTVTNWSLALILAVLRFPLAKAVRCSAGSLVICAVLALGQVAVFPQARLFFLPRSLTGESEYVQLPGAAGERTLRLPTDVVRSVLVTAAVAPEPYLLADPVKDVLIVSNQKWDGGYPWTSIHYPPAGRIAVAFWLAMLGLSIYGFVRDRKNSFAMVGAAVFIAGQLGLHLLYGDNTFLYVANFYPILLVLAAAGCSGRLRHVHAVIMGGLVLFGGWANLEAMQTALRLVDIAT